MVSALSRKRLFNLMRPLWKDFMQSTLQRTSFPALLNTWPGILWLPRLLLHDGGIYYIGLNLRLQLHYEPLYCGKMLVNVATTAVAETSKPAILQLKTAIYNYFLNCFANRIMLTACWIVYLLDQLLHSFLCLTMIK